MLSFNANEINASVFGQIESTFNIETKDLSIIDLSIHFLSILFSFTSPGHTLRLKGANDCGCRTIAFPLYLT